MKNKSYRQEDEIRLLFAPHYPSPSKIAHENNLAALIDKVEYRPRGNEYIIPYLRIKVRSKAGTEHPIKSLTVGPGVNQQTIYNALIMFVQSNFQSEDTTIVKQSPENDCECVSVGNIKVRRSLIPFITR